MRWNFYTSKELKPAGWLKKQLEVQASGLSGNLDKVWRDVRDSAWIGGDADGWERVPYWLDGFIPLAFLLDDEDLKARAKKYVDSIISKQRPDGWICPCEDKDIPQYDVWAAILISKTLTVYYDCTGEERVAESIYRILKNLLNLTKNGTIKLFGWGKFRWFEAFIAINFINEKYGEPWIKELAGILLEQGADYTKMTELWKKPLNKWTFETHIVNLCMMLKFEAVSCEISNKPYEDKAQELYDVLKKYNGTAVETFTGDECLSGLSLIQGTELCGVAELMYSYELLYAYTGDPKWAERLETVAFNAFPATNSDDMWTHQYDQMVNQISCEKFPGKPVFRTNSDQAHLFGLEPNFGCCTANFSQAWPKFALSAFMHSGDSILSGVPIPSTLCYGKTRIELKTNYPFENKLCYSIQTDKEFTLKIRIPSFASNLMLNGTPTDQTNLLELNVKEGRTDICVEFDCDTVFESRQNGLSCVKSGSLVFALPIKYESVMHEYELGGVERKFPYCDYEYVGKSQWRYAFAGEKLERCFTGISDVPFSSTHPPVTVSTTLIPIEWDYEDGYDTVCAKTPQIPITPTGEPEKIALYPYGCAKLRMTEMPVLK